MSFVLGIDLGASALKLSLIDAHAQYVGGCGIGLATDTPEPGHAEQNPGDWRAALQSGLGQLHTDFPTEVRALRAIVFTGGAHIAVLCDSSATPLRPAIMWSDQRSSAQVGNLRFCGSDVWPRPRIWFQRRTPVFSRTRLWHASSTSRSPFR